VDRIASLFPAEIKITRCAGERWQDAPRLAGTELFVGGVLLPAALVLGAILVAKRSEPYRGPYIRGVHFGRVSIWAGGARSAVRA
jgi:hypothetical protein